MITEKQSITLLEQTRITKASTRWDTLRTSIPKSVTNILQLKEGNQLLWNLITIEGKNYIIIEGGKPRTEEKSRQK